MLPLAPLALALAPLAHHVAVALFVAFAVALYVSYRHVFHGIAHILVTSHKTWKCGPFPGN